MKKITLLLLLNITSFILHAQTLYSKTFGNPQNKAIIYLHGGPGYNCSSFEVTTAQQLADKGYYVVVYDRRGEGRSEDKKAAFTFHETCNDLNDIYKKYNLKKATLLGHSFGGIVATVFTEKYPSNIESVIYIGAPITLQETFKTIIRSCKKIYQSKNDSINLKYIQMLESMDTTTLMYSVYCFGHAMSNGFYTPKNPNETAKNIYATFSTDTLLKKHAAKMTYEGPQGFWKSEKYTTINLTASIQNFVMNQIKIFGLYGKEDGLYSAEQVIALQQIIGNKNLIYYDNCSHNVYIDQQAAFIKAIQEWVQ